MSCKTIIFTFLRKTTLICRCSYICIDVIVSILRSVSYTLVYRGCINLLEQPLTFQLIIIGIVRRNKTLFLLQGITQESVHSWVYTSTLPDTWVHLPLITWYMSTFTYTYLIHDYAYMNTLHEYHTGTLLLRCIILYLLTWILVLRTTRMIY